MSEGGVHTLLRKERLDVVVGMRLDWSGKLATRDRGQN